MDVEKVIKALGYEGSPNFLRVGSRDLKTAPAFGHIFRHAAEYLGLKGVYTLRAADVEAAGPMVPVVYVCEATDDDEADLRHKLVWNQDVAPFLIVATRTSIRLYSGFRYRRRKDGTKEGLLRVLRGFNELSTIADAFHADAINDGALWRKWGAEVRPSERVDWKLLDNLRRLDHWLQGSGHLKPEVSHALIGKYVYLHYLKDRDILSSRKLANWGIEPKAVFGRDATIQGVQDVVSRLDDWLNGSVFPLHFKGQNAPSERHLQRVAATFGGDEPRDDGSWQLHLDFQAYDFSYIPIETLSVVYEQFLHEPVDGGPTTRGREAGAYYTPIPVVNFMLAEMDDRCPLQQGMRVLDPSCGSGAFLVQCYRRLIERTYPATKEDPSPVQVRDLLEKYIFGVDRDADACSVTELSLILTLLDYVDPPDLENDKRIKLPNLRDKNIFHADFFDFSPNDARWGAKKFEWIVGNPPWKKLNPANLSQNDERAWKWIVDARNLKRPVGGNQLAQAFAWGVAPFLSSDGQASLLLPAMTLFENPSTAFRSAFFKQLRIHSIANFSNLAEVLFAGRSRVPAAAFFFSHRLEGEMVEDEHISTYSPLVANQESTRPTVEGTRKDIWSLVLNASEIRNVPLTDVANGDGLPWKLAVWGSHFDHRLLSRVRKIFRSLADMEDAGTLIIAEGPQLRPTSKEGDRTLNRCEEVDGKRVLDVKKLARWRHFFDIPADAIGRNSDCYIRSGLTTGLEVCQPPHVIVSAARNFAIFSNEYLIVPPRQIGIFSPSKDAAILKALSLYLSSDFTFYHQFLTSTEFGVKRDRATLSSLRNIPVPIAQLSASDLQDWVHLHNRLVKASQRIIKHGEHEGASLFADDTDEKLTVLLDELNKLVFDALDLTERERALVEDLVHVRLELNDGKLGAAAVDPPKVTDMRRYGKRLKVELDAFIEGELPKHHEVSVVYDSMSAMLCVDLVRNGSKVNEINITQAGAEVVAELEKARRRLRKKWGQWVYFDRNLTIFEGTRTYVFKPMQRFHWTESQAMFDAGEIISRTMANVGEAP